MSAKLPKGPPADLAKRRPAWYSWPEDRPMWSIVDGKGPYARRFGEMRASGPVQSARFDPHPEPPSISPNEKVLYVACDLLTAIAERYQRRRAVIMGEPTSPIVYSWFALRPLRLIDLTGTSATRLGASQALTTGPRSVARRWARAIRSVWPDTDGLYYSSSMSGRGCAACWGPAADSFPSKPALAIPIDVPAQEFQDLVQAACAELGYEYWP